METPLIGLPKFGSNRASVIFKDDLTDADAILATPATSVASLGSDVTHDAVRGMKKGSAAGGYKITGLTDYTNANDSFILSFEIERNWVCSSAGTSEGVSPAANQDIGLIYGAGGILLLQKQTSGQLQVAFSGGAFGTNGQGGVYLDNNAVNTALNYPCHIHTAGKGDFIKCHVVFVGMQAGGIIYLCIDGLPVKAAITNYTAGAVDFFSAWDIGKNNANAVDNYYIRNMQMLAGDVPIYPVTQKFSAIAFIGDSFVAYDTGGGSGNVKNKIDNFPTYAEAGNTVYDAHYALEVKRELYNNNVFLGDYYMLPYHGSRTDGLIDTAGIALIMAENPVGLVYCAGTNDAVSGRTSAAVSTTIQSHITTAFAGSVEWMVIATIPSLRNDPTYDADIYDTYVANVNAGIRDAVATYLAANPTASIKIAEVDAAFGGVNYNANYFYSTGVHPSAEGSSIRGKLIGKACIVAAS